MEHCQAITAFFLLCEIEIKLSNWSYDPVKIVQDKSLICKCISLLLQQSVDKQPRKRNYSLAYEVFLFQTMYMFC